MPADKKSIQDEKVDDEQVVPIIEITRRFHWPFRALMLLLAWPSAPRVLQALMSGTVENRWGDVHVLADNPVRFTVTFMFWGMLVFVPLWFATFGTRIKKADEKKNSEAEL